MRSANATVRCARCSTRRTVTPRSRISPQRVEDGVDELRREAERRLVEEEQVGPGDERARDRELLLLAAGERAGLAAARTRRRSGRARAPRRRPRRCPSRVRRPAKPSRRFSSTVRFGVDPPALGHERDARARDGLGRAAADRRAARAAPRPRAAGTRPMIACSVVDLPAPFGPIRPTISPSLELERRARARRGRRRTAPRRRRARSISALDHRRLAEVRGGDVEVRADLGGRALGERPALVEHLDPVADLHHERHVVVDQQHAGLVLVAHRAHDGGELGHLALRAARRRARRGAGSAARVASARATPSLRSSPCARLPAGCSRVPRRARRARAACAARAPRLARAERPSRAPRPRRSRGRESDANDRAVLERPREPRAARGGAGSTRVTSRPPSSTVPAVGKSKPVEHVDERRLAGAVRADQPDDLVAVELERHVAERVDALEVA